MSKSIVFVVGSSGNVGKATVNALSKHYGEKLDIRAGVRNPDKVAAFKFLQGVTVVQAEMGKREKLIEVFKDVGVLFIVVPGAPNRVELTRVTAEAAKEAGVKHILFIGGDPNSRFLSLSKQMEQIESIITNLGPKHTILHLPWFIENYYAYQPTIQKSSVFYDTINPNQRFRAVCMDDVGLAAAVIMSSPEKHAGKAYTIVSDTHSFEDLAKAFSAGLGRDVKYTQQSYEEAKAAWLQNGVPESTINGLMEYWEAVNAGKMIEGNNEDFTNITGKQPTNVAEWVQRYAVAFK